MRPRGAGGRVPPTTPMSERQQLALVMQMTNTPTSSLTTPTTVNQGGRSPSQTSKTHKDRNERGETPLHLAAIKGDVELVAKLLTTAADPNAVDFAGWTPLHEACNRGWYDVALKLVQAGAAVNARGLDDDTPLHDAAINGHQKLVKLLVERGADVNAKNKKGKSPIDVASPRVLSILCAANNTSASASAKDAKEAGAINQRFANRGTRGGDDKKSDVKKCPSSPATDPPAVTSTAPIKSTLSDDLLLKDVTNSPDSKTGDPLEIASDAVDPLSIPSSQNQLDDPGGAKRPFAEMSDPLDDTNDDDPKRKKRKDSESSKDSGKSTSTPTRTQAQTKTTNKTLTVPSGKSVSKSPCPSPKASSDAETEDGKSDLKVPPLKIVLSGGAGEHHQESAARSSKNGSQRSHTLPYVVPSSNDGEKDDVSSPPDASKVGEEKKEATGTGGDDQRGSHNQRVLRSSHRGSDRSGGGGGGDNRSSNNSSPQMQSNSPTPSPSSCTTTPTTTSTDTPTTSTSTLSSKDGQTNTEAPESTSLTVTNTSTTSASASAVTTTASQSSASGTTTTTTLTDVHPRKRKMRPSNKEQSNATNSNASTASTNTTSTTSANTTAQDNSSAMNTHEQPMPTANSYEQFMNIRKQIERRRKNLFPVQPKPPQGFKNYLMNRCTYLLARNAPTQPTVTVPPSVPSTMRDMYIDQEKDRYKLRMQHVIQKEKLVLSVEQEILRVHGLAARTLANQTLPFSVCTVLRDEEVYNLITPEQEEKDRNARSRYNGRLFLSWLQDVDDKWEKIKESMLVRHHIEAESLHAVQKMDWEWKLKELGVCDSNATPHIDDVHVPMVHVSDDFDLLPT